MTGPTGEHHVTGVYTDADGYTTAHCACGAAFRHVSPFWATERQREHALGPIGRTEDRS